MSVSLSSPIHTTNVQAADPRLNAQRDKEQDTSTMTKTTVVFFSILATVVAFVVGGPALGMPVLLISTLVIWSVSDANLTIFPSSYFYSYPSSSPSWYSRPFSNWGWQRESSYSSGGRGHPHVPVGNQERTPPPSRAGQNMPVGGGARTPPPPAPAPVYQPPQNAGAGRGTPTHVPVGRKGSN